ncbi:MAG: glycosyltransferase family 39 protein [Candidatus Hodarchaeota archaeon]
MRQTTMYPVMSPKSFIKFARKRHLLLLFAIGVTGLIVRLYFGVKLPGVWDTGHFLYWGKLVLEGGIPFRDFFARDILYIYLLASSMIIFGYDFLAAIMISVISSFLTIFVIYQITSKIYNIKTGLTASAIYAFAPTVIFYDTISDMRPLMLLCASMAILILTQAIKTQDYKFFMLFGVLMGFSVFLYRGLGIYILTAPLILMFINMQSEKEVFGAFRKTMRQELYVLTGTFLSALPVYCYYSFVTNFDWIWSIWGFGGQFESATWFIIGEIAPIQHKIRIFHVAVREWLYMMIPVAVFLGIMIENKFKSRKYLKHLTIYALGIFLLVILISGEYFQPKTSFGSYESPAIFKTSFLGIIALAIILLAVIFPRIQNNFNNALVPKLGNSLVMWWFVSTSILIALYGVPLVNYYYYLSPPLTIITAIIIRATLSRSPFCTPTSKIGKEKNVVKKLMPIFFIAFLISSATITVGMMASSDINWRNQHTSTIHKIANYIEQHTSESDEILVGNPAIALISDRKIAFNILLHQMYGKVGPEPFDPLPYDPYNFFPNVHEIAEYMEKGNVKYIVEDGTGLVEHIIPLHPEWNAAFRSWYVLETVIDGRRVYVYKPEYEPS